MFQSWQEQPGWLWRGHGRNSQWFRARPKNNHSSAKAPSISYPRAEKFHTWPDGLWLNLGQRGVVDVFSVEVCGSIQNLHDKRSRYSSVGGGLTIFCPKAWLLEEVTIYGRQRKPRFQHLGLSRVSTDWHLPIRYLRVLYALPDNKMKDWRENIVPASHEYFAGHSLLRPVVAGRLRRFLEDMDPKHHFAMGR